MNTKPLPIGIDDFKKLITSGYYYVDKTLLVKELLDKKGEVNLFTRPRRFGKTLNMSMLRYFFENTGNEQLNLENKELFKGSKIEASGEQYTAEMTCYPVISLSLKSAKQPTWEKAYACLKETIENEFQRHRHIIPFLPIETDQNKFERIVQRSGNDSDYLTSLAFLSRQLEAYYRKKAIILIDEYDVPLENAHFCQFYDQMVDFIRSLFESALKTNPSLYFAVITGCLRITKESIFTGLNNLKTNSILSENYGEYFGFTPVEIEKFLQEYSCEECLSTMQRWYDGYLFGDKEVYNPWSVLNYMDAIIVNPKAFPRPYWSNTSANSIVRTLIDQADLSTQKEIGDLISGDTICKPVHEDITYEDVYTSADNLWNFLFFTGYLKKVGQELRNDQIFIHLAIPNTEVGLIYKTKVMEWFRERVELKDFTTLYDALLSGDAEVLQEEITTLLQDTISFHDDREAFYHGFMTGILGRLKNYIVKSNRESGDGRYDIMIRSLRVTKPVIIMELKFSKKYMEMETDSAEALHQIEQKSYDREFKEEGYQKSIRYGIAFYEKNCLIKKEEIDL